MLFGVAGVPIERQKLMSKAWKGILKDDVPLDSLSIQDGAQVCVASSGVDSLCGVVFV